MAPEVLSTSYLTGAPPCGISMMTLTSCGGFSPTGMWKRSIGVRPWLPAAVEDCHTVTLARWEPLPHGSRSEAIDWYDPVSLKPQECGVMSIFGDIRSAIFGRSAKAETPAAGTAAPSASAAPKASPAPSGTVTREGPAP